MQCNVLFIDYIRWCEITNRWSSFTSNKWSFRHSIFMLIMNGILESCLSGILWIFIPNPEFRVFLGGCCLGSVSSGVIVLSALLQIAPGVIGYAQPPCLTLARPTTITQIAARPPYPGGPLTGGGETKGYSFWSSVAWSAYPVSRRTLGVYL